MEKQQSVPSQSRMMEFLKRIYPLRLAPVSAGTDRCVEILKEGLPFVVHEYPTLSEYNGWLIPLNWEVEEGKIRKDGEVIYDGMVHPLGVIGYSQSFRGKVTLAELKSHLFYPQKFPDALGYHCTLYYRVGREGWGFSIPYTLYSSLAEGEYEVDLRTKHQPGTLKVCDYLLPGTSDETIVVNAHNCHAGQANDDISGVVVGMEVMKRLSQGKKRYSYRLIVAPEHFGTVFYLAGLSKNDIQKFKYGIFLEMLGNDNRLALQESFTGSAEVDKAAYHYLRHHHPDFFSDKFRKIVGNDETVWEAPGYEIPTISLSRFPYDEYHTSLDNEGIISERRLEEAVEAVLGILHILDTNQCLQRKFEGLVALSHPKYDLYFAQADPVTVPHIAEDTKRWNYLMDCLPRYFDGQTTVLDMAIKHDLPYEQVLAYVSRFAEKDLVEFV